jgi:hypothetical protein
LSTARGIRAGDFIRAGFDFKSDVSQQTFVTISTAAVPYFECVVIRDLAETKATLNGLMWVAVTLELFVPQGQQAAGSGIGKFMSGIEIGRSVSSKAVDGCDWQLTFADCPSRRKWEVLSVSLSLEVAGRLCPNGKDDGTVVHIQVLRAAVLRTRHVPSGQEQLGFAG